MVQELGSLVTAFHFNRWLPDFRRGSGSSGGLVLPAWLSKSSLNVQLGVGFFSPLPNKTFLKIILLYLNYEKWILFSATESRKYNRKSKSKIHSPGWCGSVDWVPACEPKCHGCDSQSGHKPGLLARFPTWGRARDNQPMFLSLPSLFSKKKENLLKYIKKCGKEHKMKQEDKTSLLYDKTSSTLANREIHCHIHF